MNRTRRILMRPCRTSPCIIVNSLRGQNFASHFSPQWRAVAVRLLRMVVTFFTSFFPPLYIIRPQRVLLSRERDPQVQRDQARCARSGHSCVIKSVKASSEMIDGVRQQHDYYCSIVRRTVGVGHVLAWFTSMRARVHTPSYLSNPGCSSLLLWLIPRYSKGSPLLGST